MTVVAVAAFVAVAVFDAPVVVVVAAAVAVITVANHIENSINKSKIEKETKNSYTKDEAKVAIDEVLNTYSTSDKTLNITFNNAEAEISNSYLVGSKYDRQKISMILSNTEGFERSAGSMSAEWYFHNFAYKMNIFTDSAENAGLNYVEDERGSVRFATNVFQFFGWE